eukprot:2950611-Prymnesium_polylepis.2
MIGALQGNGSAVDFACGLTRAGVQLGLERRLRLDGGLEARQRGLSDILGHSQRHEVNIG